MGRPPPSNPPSNSTTLPRPHTTPPKKKLKKASEFHGGLTPEERDNYFAEFIQGRRNVRVSFINRAM